MNRNNQISVHQAFYGEINRSHGCVYSTIENAGLKAFLTGFTDRPSSLPAGIVLQPYYSAIMYDKYYVFTLTFPDDSAIRAGMVFTHALIVKVEDIVYLNNLNNLFGYFCKTIPEERTLQELIITSSSLEVNETANLFPSYVLKSIIELTTGNLPILFCGESSSFLKLITSIWVGLPQSFRTKISYTTSFSTINIDDSKTLIYFQKNLEDLMRNVQFISDKNNEQMEANSTIEKYVLIPDIENKFQRFLEELRVELDDWVILQICAKAYEGYQNYTELNNDALKQLIRQLAKISPNRDNGISIKEKVLLEIKQRLDSAKETNLKSLKNLPLDKFESGEEILGKSIETFVNFEFAKNSHFDEELMAGVTVLSFHEIKTNWWHDAIKNGLCNIIKKEHSTEIQNIWRLLIRSEESLSVILSIFPEDKKHENLLVKYIPQNIPKSIAELYAKSIQQRKWFFLHAHLIQKYLNSKEAVKQQLFLEKRLLSDSFEGSNLIIKEVTDSDLLSLALETSEDFFIEEYSIRSVKKSTLLNKLDIKNQTWLLIWVKSLEITSNLEHGILGLSEKLEQLLSNIPNLEVPDEIINLVANSRYADISEIENRADLWKHLRLSVKNLFLEATANGLVKNISSRGLAGVIEPELMNYISSDKYMTTLLKAYRSDINVILEVYEYITNLKDSFLADYIKYYPNNITDTESARLGNLILSKRFHLSAKQTFEKSKYNSSFKIALAKCQSIARLGFWDKLSWGGLIGESISLDSVYSALVELAIKLYENGPEDNDIWKRAGGKMSKLHNHKTREENWRNAINLLRNGGGGEDISVTYLIKEMIHDHPNNSELKEIIKYFTKNNG